MDKDEVLKLAQAHLDYYGSGKYKGYEEVTLSDGRPAIRFTIPLRANEQSIRDAEGNDDWGRPGRPGSPSRDRPKSQMSTERDTHFQGAAKLLLEKLMTKYDHLPPGTFGPAERDEQIITHFLYDFKEHVLLSVEVSNPDSETGEKPLVRVPDMTE